MGSYAFVIPGTDIFLPRLNLISKWTLPFGRQLYFVMEFPLQLLGLIPFVHQIIFFSGEGVLTVRPFMIFVFWFLAGVGSILRGRRKVGASPTYDNGDSEPSHLELKENITSPVANTDLEGLNPSDK